MIIKYFYSVLRLLTGLAIAAVAVLMTTVDIAIKNMMQNKITSNLKLTPSLNAKKLTTKLLTIYPSGMQIAAAMIINFKKPTDSSFIIAQTEAPITLRMPISFKRFSVLYVTIPINPIIAIINTTKEIMPMNCMSAPG